MSENELTREELEREVEAARAKVARLEASAKEYANLPDAPTAGIEHLAAAIKVAKENLASGEEALSKIVATETDAELKKETEERPQLVERCQQAIRERRFSDLPKPLRDRYLRAVEEEGAAKLFNK